MTIPTIHKLPVAPTQAVFTSPLDRIRSKGYHPLELYTQVEALRSFGHFALADLCEAEIEARAVAAKMHEARFKSWVRRRQGGLPVTRRAA